MSAERRLRSDVFLMLSTKFGVLILSMISSIFVARVLAPSGRGAVAVALSLTLLLVQCGSAGLSTANPYFAAKYPAARDRIIGNSVYLALLIGLVLMGVTVVIKIEFPSVVRGLDWVQLSLVMAALPAALATAYLHSVLLGEGRTVAYNLIELVLAVTWTAVMVVGLEVFEIGVTGALVVMLLGQVTAALCYLVSLVSRAGFSWPLPDIALARSMFGYATKIYVATLLAFLVIRLDMLMVNAYIGTAEVGVYSVAVALCDGLYVLPTVIAVNLFPRVARGLEHESTAQVFRSMFIIFAAICLFTVPFAGIAIQVLYGSAYSDATELYYWLLPGIFCMGMLNILAHDFAGRGYPLEAALVWFIGVAVNVGINVLFLRPGHLYVAALSSTIAYGLLLFLHMRMFARDVGGYRSLIPHMGETIRFVRVAVGRTL
jgi:O-antigen/teichoic acid export membrane protein